MFADINVAVFLICYQQVVLKYWTTYQFLIINKKTKTTKNYLVIYPYILSDRKPLNKLNSTRCFPSQWHGIKYKSSNRICQMGLTLSQERNINNECVIRDFFNTTGDLSQDLVNFHELVKLLYKLYVFGHWKYWDLPQLPKVKDWRLFTNIIGNQLVTFSSVAQSSQVCLHNRNI